MRRWRRTIKYWLIDLGREKFSCHQIATQLRAKEFIKQSLNSLHVKTLSFQLPLQSKN
jgi:hypothetical protein